MRLPDVLLKAVPKWIIGWEAPEIVTVSDRTMLRCQRDYLQNVGDPEPNGQPRLPDCAGRSN